MLKKYKLIQCYPGSPKLGTIIIRNSYGYCFYEDSDTASFKLENIEDYSNFWQEIKEVKLEVPIGTRFQHHSTKDFVYMINAVKDNIVQVTWDFDSTTYTVDMVNTFFKNGTWIIYKEKEFEILEFKTSYDSRIIKLNPEGDYSSEGGIPCSLNIELEWVKTGTRIISKVKRLSDGVIFSVGDKVKYPQGSIKWNIDNFYIGGNEVLLVRSKDCLNVETISTIEHCKNLFLDELGNEVFEGDPFYFVNPMFWDLEKGKAQYGDLRTEIHHFKNKVDALEYIDKNRPIFSKKQVEEALDWGKHEYYNSMNSTKWYRVFKDKLGL
jgi:hypothetical protein